MKPAIIEMLGEWLVSKGFDGLYNRDKLCSCSISDIIACPEHIMQCVPAQKAKCDCKKKCEFHLVPVEEC